MTEAEWLVCADPEQMFRCIGDRDSVRRSRCVLRELLLPGVLRACNEHEGAWVRAEIDLWVDDQDSDHATARPFPKVVADWIGATWPSPEGCRRPEEPRDPDRCLARRLSHRQGDDVKQRACCVLRDLFGPLPFRTTTLDPSRLPASVVALAEGIYGQRAFDQMPILADALQDAGCDNEDILNHCRQPGEHVRGCWVVDLLLGKS
jgi:hypothetical protein